MLVTKMRSGNGIFHMLSHCVVFGHVVLTIAL